MWFMKIVAITERINVTILRWYWWRVNAWSEVLAMGSALIVSLTLRLFFDATSPRGFAISLVITTAITTVVWLVVTFATSPEPRETLHRFYDKVRPGGRGWSAVAAELNIVPPRGEIARSTVCWLLGVVLVYSLMFAVGAWLFGKDRSLMIFGTTTIVSTILLIVIMRAERKTLLTGDAEQPTLA